ncbi:hypothetical protein CHS0354_043029 [Potamilus streckersoni]|uniref:p-glycoprotein n=1 Tax=Potamilus streckersoni TaxID=2493646 RepID=A0AAE0VUL1_9BIVA|nr:hypothetical protein CHS0354_043029 [Potamilus streckersoni]
MSEPQLMGYKPTQNEGLHKESSSANGGIKTGKVSPAQVRGMEFHQNELNNRGEKETNGVVVDMKSEEVVIKSGKNGDASFSSDDDKDKKKKEQQPLVGVFEVFRFADKLDVVLMIFGMLFACCHGSALPGMIIVFGDMIDLFVNHGKQFVTTNVSVSTTAPDLQKDLVGTMTTYAIYYVIIGGGVILVGYCQVAFWMLASERQSFRIRLRFFRNIMRQEIGWFDTHESGELNTRLADDVGKIHDGIGDKLGSFFQWLSGGIAGFTIGFVFGWKLTLVILAISPLLGACAFTMTKLVSSMSGKELKAYAKAGAVAEEVLGAIRTVTAFGGQEKECRRYNANLIEARDFGIKKGFINGVAVGIVWLVIFCAYALGFWYGAKLIREENYSIGNVMIVFFSVLIGAFSLGHAAPDVQSFSVARGAAYVVYKLIDQNPDIDSDSDSGMKPNSVTGTIEFKNVHFNYPSRPDVKVLNGVNLKVNRGETVALVGSSGCGKSTTVQLIQRFYDVGEGAILLDGVDIKQLNVKWLRQNIGIVSQEPVLFGTTISENIRYGREGVTQKEIEEAAIMANAHSFIKDLPDKYDTLVGERGAQLSGGQKQRIAIARALVRDPKILLLDEATSALDTESESVVQEALERASHGRTTIIIAHRLSTIKNADKIAGFKDGVIKEIGTHNELMQHKGIYCQLVTLQTQQQDDEDLEIEDLVNDASAIQNKLQHQISFVESPLKRQISMKEELKEDKKEEEKAPQVSVTRILRMNASEWYLILLGCFGSLINGGVMPAFAIIFSEILGVFVKPHSEQEQPIAMYCGIFIAIGGASFIAYFVQGYTFGRSGEYLTMRLREMSFRAMLRQEIAWFDDHKNNTGALTTRLATDASQVQGASGIRLGTMIQSVASIVTGVVIAFVYGWKMSLVLLGFLPFIAIAGALQMKILSGVAGKNKEALEGAGKVAVEGVENIRTVASLTKEEMFYQNYKSTLTEPYKAALKKAHVVGITFSISQAIIFFAYATAFWFGAWLIEKGEMKYVDVFKVFSAIVFGAMAIGQASSFAPDAGKASASAGYIFALLDRVPSIDVQSEDGLKLTEGQFTSKVVFKDVKFRYPNRPDVTVLNGLDLSVNPGETVALVGSSGCGKSTTVQLTERFYDVEDGVVTLDKYNVKDLNLHWLRSQIGIVSQEPVLFGTSIAENIAYGDNSRSVMMDEIIAAARKANIHAFIESLPQGYDTNVGDKGAQLSGGQKQRVAIARALLRNPKILLLDEATSALDTESEKIVQEALDRAQEGRTCIVIAHRLSTIQNADKICVIRHGQVVEQGTHSELLAKQGFYYKLNMAQQRKRL